MTEPAGSDTFAETGVSPDEAAAAYAPDAARPPAARRRPTAPIVPGQNIAARALILVIAIMTFLSCLTLGAVTLVRGAALTWDGQISREATIQIKPVDGLDMEAALQKAQAIAARFKGVTGASIVSREATARLLEPWLGKGLDIDELPVPRLVVVTIDTAHPPDFASMRNLVKAEIQSASLDDHRSWVDRLIAMAHMTVTIGIAVLVLMLSATVLSIVFATRGAMAGNGHIIEVLHFVGADARFIAAEFRGHFLLMGLKGAAAGGIGAIIVFLVFAWISARNMATPQADQAAALFGNFGIDASGYAGVGLIVLLIAGLTAATSHFTVVRYLADIETRQPEQ
jgi:cell division transport system permease protein